MRKSWGTEPTLQTADLNQGHLENHEAQSDSASGLIRETQQNTKIILRF